MAVAPIEKYGKLTVPETLTMAASLVPFPFSIFWSVLTTMYAPRNKQRSLKRITAEAAFRYLLSKLSVAQLQCAFGSTSGMYEKWTKQAQLPAKIDELGDDTRLLWIGPKRLERVLLIVHGGAYFLPATDFCCKFWRHVQLQLEKQNIEVGIALFSYALWPYAVFPTPLRQSVSAVNLLLAEGVKPHNMQIAGDSAGGNIIVQLFSHMLHPLESVPKVNLLAPLQGAVLISPWVSLSADSKSHFENDGLDYLRRHTLGDWGAKVLKDVPDAERVYVEALRAPEGWLDGAERCAKRMMISVGGAEILRDDIIQFGETMKKHHPAVETVVQQDGVHEDFILDFAVDEPESKLASLTPLTIEWLAAGFKESSD